MGALTAITVLGLGEAGAAIAADLAAAGAVVRGWDPRPEARAKGVVRLHTPADAVVGADVVLSVNAPGAALDAARAVQRTLHVGQVFADLNSAGPALKSRLAELVEPTGAEFVDVALMAPVPGRGVRTPAYASGAGAEEFARYLRPLGMPVQVVGPSPGDAARRKLLRSVFMKGLAAAVLESLAGARAAGCEEWLRREIVAELDHADAGLIERLESGSRRHAARRVDELSEAGEVLRELEVEPRVTDAARGWMTELRDA